MDAELHLEISGYRTPSLIHFSATSLALSRAGLRAPIRPGLGHSLPRKPQPPGLVSLTSPPGVPVYPLQPLGPLRSPARAFAQVHTGPKASSAPCSLVSSPLRLPEYPLQGPLRPRSEVREDFPPLPVELQATCRILRGGSLSWQERALRAWEAGCWARAVLNKEVETPNSLQPLGLTNRFYCVLIAEGLSQPCVSTRPLLAPCAVVALCPTPFPPRARADCTLQVVVCPFLLCDGLCCPTLC